MDNLSKKERKSTFSKKELIDLFEGIKHIKKKELHLLHKNSIKDDPSRLLRCAKYASRLNFQISQQSLIFVC